MADLIKQYDEKLKIQGFKISEKYSSSIFYEYLIAFIDKYVLIIK